MTVNKGGPITATSIIENCPETGGESDDGLVTPRNPRKRSSSEPGIVPNAPPQCKLLYYFREEHERVIMSTSCIFFKSIDLIESSWELPDGKTPVAIRRPSANPSASAHSTHTIGGNVYLRTMASGGRINQRQHTFSQKTIIKPENCLPCGNRYRFTYSCFCPCRHM